MHLLQVAAQLQHVLPAPSNGEFAPVFSVSADFDILISVKGKTQNQVSSEVCLRHKVQTEAENLADHNLDDERRKRVARVLI